MPVAGGESGSSDHDDDLADLITLLDDLVNDLRERVRLNQDDEIRGSTRIYVIATILPEVRRVLEGCAESEAGRLALMYVKGREAAQDAGQVVGSNLQELGAEQLGKPDTELKIRDELTPLRGVLLALKVEQRRRSGRPTNRRGSPRSGHASPDWSSPPSGIEGRQYREASKAQPVEPDITPSKNNDKLFIF